MRKLFNVIWFWTTGHIVVSKILWELVMTIDISVSQRLTEELESRDVGGSDTNHFYVLG